MAEAQSTLGTILINDGRYAEAEVALHKSVEIFAQANSRSTYSAQPLYLLVILHARQGNLTAARDFARQYYQLMRSILGPESEITIEGDLLWARYRADTGEAAEAIRQVLADMPVIRRTYPALSINLWTPLMSAAHIFNLAGRFAEAEPYAREGLAVVDALPSPELDQRRAGTLMELGTALQGEKKYRGATSTFERADRIYAQLGPTWALRGEQVRKKLSELRSQAKK